MNSAAVQWVPTSAAALALGCSAQYLKKSRDLKGGFLQEGLHYRLPISGNSSNTWNLATVEEAFAERGRKVHQDRLARLAKERQD